MNRILLELTHITKTFPGTKALDDVSFELREGEIHALVGENGAGKSTLIKVMTGVHQPDRGEIFFDGQRVSVSSPLVAQKLGIAAIFQQPASYPDLTVAENIYFDRPFMAGGFVNRRKMKNEAQKLLSSIGASFSASAVMGELSVGQQQMVEIAKALSQNARVLIMDEPTAALSRKESEELYTITRQLKEQGVSIILISHRFEDIFTLADRATVFRDARYIGTWDLKELDESTLVRYMVGHEIGDYYPKREPVIGKEVLRVEHLTKRGSFSEISFTLHAGEIVSLTGLVGAGRTEIVEAIFGMTRADSGTVYVKEEKVSARRSPRSMMDKGLGWLPEDRLTQGLHLKWSMKHNLSLPILDRCKKLLFISGAKENENAARMKQLLSIKAGSVETPPIALSGGNQQKVVIGKILSANCSIVVLDEPTMGVDVASKAQIYRLMNELTKQGIGILMISSEMPEVMNLSDRIYVLCEGRITGELSAQGVTQERIMNAAMNRKEA